MFKTTILIIFLCLINLSLSSSFSCVSNFDCNNGVCEKFDNGGPLCYCFPGFNSIDDEPCNNKLKEQTAAVFNGTIFGVFGAIWFYLAAGNWVYMFVGILQLLLLIAFIVFSVIYNITKDTCVYISLLVVWIIVTVGWVSVFILSIANVLHDGNGFEVVRW